MVWTSLLRKINIKRKRNVVSVIKQLSGKINCGFIWTYDSQLFDLLIDLRSVCLCIYIVDMESLNKQRNFISENKKSCTVVITQTKYENFWQCCLVYITGTLQKSCIGDWKIPSYSWYGPNFVTIGKYQMSKILWILLLCWSLGSVGVVENANFTYKWMNKNGGMGVS